MAQSFIPQDTKVICTYMTISEPRLIKAVMDAHVRHTDKDHPFLTVIDNKLSNTFSCKAPGKLWGGFQALCIGIAIGAAIVLTGGLAAAVIITALVVSVYAGGTALYKMAHDCDATLQVHWKLPHKKVWIQGENAILNKSLLYCPKGGTVSLIMDPEIATEAAAEISRYNNEEILSQMTSQMFIGAVATATAGPGAILSAGLTAGLYFPAEWMAVRDNKIASNAATTNVGGAVVADLGSKWISKEAALFNQDVASLIKGSYQTVAAEVTGDAAQGLEGAFRIALANRNLAKFKEGSKFNGYGAIGGVLANITVGYISDKIEDHLAEEAKEAAAEERARDEKNGINVLSIQ